MALRIFLGWSLLSLAGVAAVLAGLDIDRGPASDSAAANLGALRPLWLASASGWAALTGVWVALRRGAGATISAAGAVAIILLVAAGARTAVLLSHAPTLSDDAYRYVFDGRNLAAGVNPYLVRPQDRIGAADPRWPGEPHIALLCNNPEMYTIYLPASQWAFGAVALVGPDAPEPAAAVMPLRITFVVGELIAIAMLLVALVRAERSPWWAVLYAWHPLPLIEIAGSGHQDALGIVFLVAALLLAGAPGARPWRWIPVLAVAVLVKPIVLPAAAFVLRRRPWRAWAGAAALGAAVCTVIAAPLLLASGGEPLANLLDTTERFRLKWAHFGGASEGLLWIIERLSPGWGNDPQEVLARRICLGVLVFVLALLWWRPQRPRWAGRLRVLLPPDTPWAATAAALTAMVLLAPVVHPWYLLWALALIPMAPGATLWTATLTIPWGYAAWAHLDAEGLRAWGTSAWLLYAAWVPVYAALGLTLVQRARAARSTTPSST